MARGERGTQPVPRIRANAVRQVTPHRPRVAIDQPGVEIDLARAVAGGAVTAVRTALCIGVLEAERFDRHLGFALAARPAGTRLELCKSDLRLREHRRQIEHQPGRVDLHAAARVAAFDATTQPAHAGQAAVGTQTQTLQPGADTEGLRRGQRAGPAAVQFVDQAFGGMPAQPFAHVVRQRQIAGQPGERAEIERTGRHLAMLRRAFGSRLPVDVQAGRPQCQTVAGGQLQLAGGGNHPLGAELFRADPAGQADQIEQRQRRRQPELHIGQRQFAGHFGQPGTVEARPQPGGATATRQFHRVIHPGLPDRHVGTFQRHEQVAAGSAQVVAVRQRHLAANVQPARQFGRRRRRQTEAVIAAGIVQPHVDMGELQWRRGRPPAVVPLQPGIADIDLALRQQPAGEAALLAVLPDFQTGHEQPAVGFAPYPQIGAVDVQPVQMQFAAHQRRETERGFDLLQPQRGLAGFVQQRQAAQRQLRVQTGPVGAQAVDAHLALQRLAQRLFNARPVQIDLGQHPVTRHQHHRCGEHPGPQHGFECPADKAPPARAGRNRGARGDRCGGFSVDRLGQDGSLRAVNAWLTASVKRCGSVPATRAVTTPVSCRRHTRFCGFFA